MELSPSSIPFSKEKNPSQVFFIAIIELPLVPKEAWQ
jgi:hypothetical protein